MKHLTPENARRLMDPGDNIHLRTSSRIVRLDVPSLPGEEDDPWLRYAGMWTDDPDWDIFQAEVEAFRQTIDAQTQANNI
jgi:hypothetical protein